MKIMLDSGENKIVSLEKELSFPLWQLQTPLSRRKLSTRPYGLDNGCYANFKQKTWERMLIEAKTNKPIFVCLPDIVGDARRTLELFNQFEQITQHLPRALVLQDGIGDFDIPWDKLAAVFVGGTDTFKISPECINACKTAKILGKWVHIGRVNTVNRLSNWMGFADSIDGSGISKYDHMIVDVINLIKSVPQQIELI